jgi:hypothetical protein
MFSNSIKIIKTDRNMSKLWQILCKKFNFNIGALVGFIVSIVYYFANKNNIKTIMDCYKFKTGRFH